MYATRMLHPLREENIQGSIYGIASGLNSHKKVSHLRSLILIKDEEIEGIKEIISREEINEMIDKKLIEGVYYEEVTKG